MTFLRNALATSLLLFASAVAHGDPSMDTNEDASSAINSCKIVNRSGDMDTWACRNKSGKYICYATFQCDNGKRFTQVTRWCTGSFSDCW